MNMCLLKEAMCEKCRSSHLQLEGGSKKCEDWGGLKVFRTGGGYQFGVIYFCWGVSVPHYIPCDIFDGLPSFNYLANQVKSLWMILLLDYLLLLMHCLQQHRQWCHVMHH